MSRKGVRPSYFTYQGSDPLSGCDSRGLTPLCGGRLGCRAMPILSAERIRHQVVFTLKHEEGSPEEADFIAAITALSAIAGVEEFQLMREVSPKNAYVYA